MSCLVSHGVMVALLLLLQDDRLIERLAADSIVEREAAFEKLTVRGVAALPALRAHAESDDAELKGRVIAAIAEIERRERLVALAPPLKRWSCETEGALEDIVGQFAEALGCEEPDVHPALRKKRIRLSLRDATFWQAATALWAEAGAEPPPIHLRLGQPWRMRAPTSQSFGTAFADVGDSRVAIWVTAGRSTRFDACISIPPGQMAWGAEITKLEVRDGETLVDTPDRGDDERFCRKLRTPGLPLSLAAPGRIVPAGLEGRRELAIRGELTYVRAKDVVARSHLAGSKEGNDWDAQGSRVDGATLAVDARGWTASLSVTSEGGRFLLAWLEDAKGRWLDDVLAIPLSSAWKILSPSGFWTTGREPAKLVVAIVTETERVRVPFELKLTLR